MPVIISGGSGNSTIDGSNGVVFSTWTTAGRTTANVTGQTGYNTTFSALESWSGTAWVAVALQTNQYSASYLVVAGGGGGGYYGGGGGAGGYLATTTTLGIGTTYTITVGAGGAGGGCASCCGPGGTTNSSGRSAALSQKPRPGLPRRCNNIPSGVVRSTSVPIP
jgi:hypothetical protein